jgi:hypothetical protein
MKKKTITRLHFGATGWLLDFVDCEDVVDGVLNVFRGWRISRQKVTAKKARGVVARTSDGWSWTEQGAHKPREWDPKPPKTVMRVVNDVHDVAIYWYLNEQRRYLCLHGAAAEIGGALVCFPAAHRAGKSTMMAALAAAGARVFGDDVLILHRGRGVAYGFLPRLRVPLFSGLGTKLRTYIETHQSFADDKWIYLKPERAHHADFGVSKPIKAFVLLERQTGAVATLAPARTADVLRYLIAENIIRVIPMTTIFDRLYRISKSKPKFKLIYSDPEEAAALLMREFG